MAHAAGVPAQKAVKGHGFGADVVAGQNARACQAGQRVHQCKPRAVRALFGHPHRRPEIRPGALRGADVAHDRQPFAALLGQGELQPLAAAVIKIEKLGPVDHGQLPVKVQVYKFHYPAGLLGLCQPERGPAAHRALPPVMGRVTPVIKPASSPSKNAMAGTTSAGRALRIRSLVSARNFVSIMLGATQFTVTPKGA